VAVFNSKYHKAALAVGSTAHISGHPLLIARLAVSPACLMLRHYGDALLFLTQGKVPRV